MRSMRCCGSRAPAAVPENSCSADCKQRAAFAQRPGSTHVSVAEMIAPGFGIIHSHADNAPLLRESVAIDVPPGAGAHLAQKGTRLCRTGDSHRRPRPDPRARPATWVPQLSSGESARCGVDWATAVGLVTCRVTRRGCCGWSARCGSFGVEVQDPGWQREVEDGVQPRTSALGVLVWWNSPAGPVKVPTCRRCSSARARGQVVGGAVGSRRWGSSAARASRARRARGCGPRSGDRPGAGPGPASCPASRVDLEKLVVAQRDVLGRQAWIAERSRTCRSASRRR